MIQILAPLANTLIKRLFPDKEKQQEAQLEFQSMIADGSFKEFEKQADIIIAEAQSKSWLTSNWRPCIMILFGIKHLVCQINNLKAIQELFLVGFGLMVIISL